MRQHEAPSHSTRPGSLMCTCMSTMPGDMTRLPKSSTASLLLLKAAWAAAARLVAPSRAATPAMRPPAMATAFEDSSTRSARCHRRVHTCLNGTGHCSVSDQDSVGEHGLLSSTKSLHQEHRPQAHAD